MKLVKPHSTQYGRVDEVVRDIVSSLEKLDLEFPDFVVELDETGNGDYDMVDTITGPDFSLWFYRWQGPLTTEYPDLAAVAEINIPQQQISLKANESGLRYITYVGESWEKDKAWFMVSSKIHAKLHQKPRRYLVYSGHADPEGTYLFRNRRNPYLVSDNDLGREYSPEGDEPHYYITEKVLEGFASWLEQNVLAKLQAELKKKNLS